MDSCLQANKFKQIIGSNLLAIPLPLSSLGSSSLVVPSERIFKNKLLHVM